MASDLLKKGRTSVKGMWSEKKGAAYDAVVVLDDTGEKYVRFKLEFPNGGGREWQIKQSGYSLAALNRT